MYPPSDFSFESFMVLVLFFVVACVVKWFTDRNK